MNALTPIPNVGYETEQQQPLIGIHIFEYGSKQFGVLVVACLMRGPGMATELGNRSRIHSSLDSAASATPTLSAVQWEQSAAPQYLTADTVRELFPDYKVGGQLSAVVVMPDGYELLVKIGRSSVRRSFKCVLGWGAVRAAADLQNGQVFGEPNIKCHQIALCTAPNGKSPS